MISSRSGRTDLTETLLSGDNISLDIQDVRENFKLPLFCVQIGLPLSPSIQTNGWSALFFAADRGDVATTELLLKAGADPHLRDQVSNS